ncbi:uncharacterized protein LOC778867 [Ciona intestinalis]
MFFRLFVSISMDVVEAATFSSQTDHIQHEVKEYLSTSTNETLLKEPDDKVMDSKPQDSSFEISNDSFSSENSSVYASPIGDLNEAETKIYEKHEKPDENENSKITQMDIEEQTRNQAETVTKTDMQHEKQDENIDITQMEVGEQTETENKTDKLNEKPDGNTEVLQMDIDKQNTNEAVTKTKINEVNEKLEENAGIKQIDQENTTGVDTTPKGNGDSIAGENTAVKIAENVTDEILDEKTETTLQECQPNSTEGVNKLGEATNNVDGVIIKQEPNDMNDSLPSIEELQIDEDLKPETSVETMKIKQEVPDVTSTSEPLVSNTATTSVTAMSSLMENELFKILSQDQTPISSPILSLPCSSVTTDTGASSKTGVAVKTTVIPTSHPSGPQNRKRAKEVFLVKSIQTQEKPSITTAKAKIRPIFDEVNPKNKSNAFPIIYIGAPNILDMQAYRKQVKAEEEALAKKLPDVPMSYLDEETGQMVTKAENKPTPTVSSTLKTIPLDTNTSSITKTVTSTTSTGKPFKFIVASKQDQFSVRKTMKAFLPDGEVKEIRTKSTFSIPLSKSMVPSFEDESSPSMVYTSPLDKKKTVHKPLVYPKPIRIDKPGNKSIPASTKISTVSVKCTSVTPTVLKPTTPVVLPIPTSSESGRPFKLIVRKRSPMNQDGKTVLPKVTISTATLSTTSSTIKVVKPDANQVYKWKLQKPMNKSEIVQVLKPNLAKTSSPSSFKPTVTIPTTAVNKQEIPTTKVVTVSKPLIRTGGAILPKKVDQLVKSKERRFTRKGMLVMFEDGVKQWVDNMRNVTYADDEPIKSWRVKPGTKVAVKYSDGLFYDAEVISSYDGSSTTEADTVEKKPIEKPQEPKTPVPPIKKVNNILNRPVRKTQTIEVKNKVPKLPKQSEDLKPLPAKEEEISAETNLAKKRTPVIKYQKRNLKRKLSPPPMETAASESDEQPVLKVPRVHIKKMAEKYTVSCESDVSDETDKQQSVANPPSTVSKADNSEVLPTGEVVKTKCPTCFLVFTDESDFNRHHKSVCHAQGVTLTVRAGGVLSITTLVEVDEHAGPPPIFATELKKREDAESKEEEYVPRSPGGKRLFRRGTRILHRWQTPKGSSRWYNGKILRLLPNKVGKSEFEVEYTDDDHDVGPYAVTLCDDYPHDIRVIIR